MPVIKLTSIRMTSKQYEILKRIHSLAKELEEIYCVGKIKYLTALLEELTNDVISKEYLQEKLDLLFK